MYLGMLCSNSDCLNLAATPSQLNPLHTVSKAQEAHSCKQIGLPC